jgi:hypothetical protein
VTDRPVLDGKEAVFVTVTPEMEKAGVDELRSSAGETDLGYVARSVYMAMEYQRLASSGELGGLTDEAVKVFKRER